MGELGLEVGTWVIKSQIYIIKANCQHCSVSSPAFPVPRMLSVCPSSCLYVSWFDPLLFHSSPLNYELATGLCCSLSESQPRASAKVWQVQCHLLRAPDLPPQRPISVHEISPHKPSIVQTVN